MTQIDRHLGASARKSRIAATRKWFIDAPHTYASLTAFGFTQSRGHKRIDSLALV